MIITFSSIFIICLTFICLCLLVHGLYKEDEDTVFYSLMATILVGVLGWLLLFNVGQAIKIQQPIECHVVTALDKAIYFTDAKGTPYLTVTDTAVYKTYANTTNRIIIQQHGYINYYGKTNWQQTYTYNY